MGKKVKKYEFKLFEGNMIMVQRELHILQSEGWELAGQISTQYASSSTGTNRMLIPLKREIN